MAWETTEYACKYRERASGIEVCTTLCADPSPTTPGPSTMTFIARAARQGSQAKRSNVTTTAYGLLQLTLLTDNIVCDPLRLHHRVRAQMVLASCVMVSAYLPLTRRISPPSPPWTAAPYPSLSSRSWRRGGCRWPTRGHLPGYYPSSGSASVRLCSPVSVSGW